MLTHKSSLIFILLLTFISSCSNKKFVGKRAESEYRINNSVPQEHIRFSPLRYTAERGKVFMVVEVQPTEVVARPGFNQYQLYNQTLRGIMQSECANKYKGMNASLAFVEYLDIQTQKYSNHSYRTWGKAVCHGYMKGMDYNI